MSEKDKNTTTMGKSSGPSAEIGETVGAGSQSFLSGFESEQEGSKLAKLQAENAELRETIRSGEARAALTAALAEAGARTPALLFEAMRAEVQFDADGKPQNVAELVGRMRSAYPEQFGTQVSGSIDAGAGRTAAPGLTRETLARMKPSEIAELDWAEVRRVLAAS